jgi:hypothetical protein
VSRNSLVGPMDEGLAVGVSVESPVGAGVGLVCVEWMRMIMHVRKSLDVSSVEDDFINYLSV